MRCTAPDYDDDMRDCGNEDFEVRVVTKLTLDLSGEVEDYRLDFDAFNPRTLRVVCKRCDAVVTDFDDETRELLEKLHRQFDGATTAPRPMPTHPDLQFVYVYGELLPGESEDTPRVENGVFELGKFVTTHEPIAVLASHLLGGMVDGRRVVRVEVGRRGEGAVLDSVHTLTTEQCNVPKEVTA